MDCPCNADGEFVTKEPEEYTLWTFFVDFLLYFGTFSSLIAYWIVKCIRFSYEIDICQSEREKRLCKDCSKNKKKEITNNNSYKRNRNHKNYKSLGNKKEKKAQQQASENKENKVLPLEYQGNNGQQEEIKKGWEFDKYLIRL